MLTDPAPLFATVGTSAAVAFVAWRVRALSVRGSLAAGMIGCAALAVSWGTGAYLIAWFLLATVLSKLGKQRKAARVSGIIDKGSQRDAWQVMANGGVFFLLCVVVILSTRAAMEPATTPALNTLLLVAAAGALAASGADTWATEVGTLYGGAPWSLRSGSRVPAGTSGAITRSGTLAMVVGACVLASLAAVFQVTPRKLQAFVSIAAGGVAGAVTDTLVGAWWQERLWCPRCTEETEQTTHRCGTPTVLHRGIGGLNNDVVNLLCSLAGAVWAGLLLLV